MDLERSVQANLIHTDSANQIFNKTLKKFKKQQRILEEE